MNIGKSLRYLRKNHAKVNQLVFAGKIGITQGYLSQIEKGRKKPSTELLESIAKEIGIPLPIMLWFGVEESDISESKRGAYRILKPNIDTLIGSLIKTGHQTTLS